jgi:hypothetical protein
MISQKKGTVPFSIGLRKRALAHGWKQKEKDLRTTPATAPWRPLHLFRGWPLLHGHPRYRASHQEGGHPDAAYRPPFSRVERRPRRLHAQHRSRRWVHVSHVGPAMLGACRARSGGKARGVPTFSVGARRDARRRPDHHRAPMPMPYDGRPPRNSSRRRRAFDRGRWQPSDRRPSHQAHPDQPQEEH